MDASQLLQMRKITKSYEGTHALREVDFSASAGEVHALAGENGAGKSTLVKILSGAVQRDSGEILLEGSPADVGSPLRAHRLGIRAVYQEFSLVHHLTITENILIGRMPTRGPRWWIDWRGANARAEQVLEEIGFTGLDVRKRVSQLSVSHQQMVEIAKAVTHKPRILILDEPSAVLSEEELMRLFALLRKLKAGGTLVLYISHRLEEVFEVADRITVLKDGQLVGTVRPQETDQGSLIRMMVGRTLSEVYPRRDGKRGETVLEVRGLARRGDFEDISFALARGEILGCFGLIGSGRTQVARCIFGAEGSTAGEVRLGGRALRTRSPRDALREGIALLTEDRKRDGLVMTCSIRDNVSLASLDQISRLLIVDRRRQGQRVSKLVADLDIRPPLIDRLVRQLSGGNQQKVVLAKWLMTQAKVLLLDEPTRGVDVATKVEVYQIISQLAEHGVGILLISSELPEILGMSDRVLVMRDGHIAAEFPRAEASEQRVLAAAAGVNP